MPKEVLEITDFNQGTVTTPSERDITPETAAYSLNIDPLTEDGKLIGVPQDRIIASLSENVPFEPLNYGLQWGATAIRIADLTKVPEPSTDGNGTRIVFQGTRGIIEILKYTSSYFDTSQIKDSTLNIEKGYSNASGELGTYETQLLIIDFALKRPDLLNTGDVIALSSETDVANIPKSIEWMRIVDISQESSLITVERGQYNTTPVSYTSLSTNTNIYKLTGFLGWLNITGWQENFQSNHVGQNPCIIYVANAGASSAFNLTHDSTNKTVTITSGSLVNNIGTSDALEDLIKNNDVIKIINASGGIATIKIDYMADGVINYSDISGSLSTQTSGSYWIDANKIANGNFRAYDTSADGKSPYAWTTTINPSGTATYDDAYADDTKSIGSPQLSTTGGITGLKGNERDTSNSSYDSAESPFLILSNARDTSTAVNSITLTDALIKDSNNDRFRVSNPAVFSEGDTLVLSHGTGVTLDNTSGNAFLGTDDNPYLQNHSSPGYMWEAINAASFTDNDTFEINVPTSIGGSGVTSTMRLEDTSSATLTSAGANTYINVSNEDAAGTNASDAQLAENIAAAINGCSDAQRVTYGTTTGVGDTTNGIAGLAAAVNSETSTKVDIWPINGLSEEYVKIKTIEVSQDAGGDAQPGFITVKRAYHGNLQAHTAGTSIKRLLRNQIKQTIGASGFDAVEEGKKYKLTWWVADVTKAWLQNNDYHLKPRLNFKVGFAGGFLLDSTSWSADKNIVGASGEKAWINSKNYTSAIDGNVKTAKGDFGGSLYTTLNGQVDIYGNAASQWVQATVDKGFQVGEENLLGIGSTISIVQDSGTDYNGNWTVGDATDANFVNSNNSSFASSPPTALIHLSGAIHDKSIIGIPDANGRQRYYTGWDTALAGESSLNSNGSDPKRRFYLEFEDYVGFITATQHHPHYLTEFFLSAADGTFSYFQFPVRANDYNWIPGNIGTYGETVSNATVRYDTGDINSARDRTYWLVPTDGSDVGFWKTQPTQMAANTPYLGDHTDSTAGGKLQTGAVWAAALKECIEAAFPTQFTVTRSGGALCIEDAIGGEIAPVIQNALEGVYYSWEGLGSGGETHGRMFCAPVMVGHWGNSWLTSFQWWASVDNNGNGGATHKGFFKGDGLGGIISGGGYPSGDYGGSDLNWVDEFTTCYHIGATPNAGEGATNLDLAIEHANGHNGTITGAVANTDELTLTRTEGVGSQPLDTIRFPDRLEANSNTMFNEGTVSRHLFEFYSDTTDDYNSGAKSILWHKCEFEFTLPDDKDISTLDVYFESDGEVWGGRDGGTIGTTVSDKFSSLIGLDSVSLVETVDILPSIEAHTEITESSNIKDSEGKEVLIYHNSSDDSLNVIKDFGDPLDGHENIYDANLTFFDATVNTYPSFTKNNREFHIGMGPDNESLWAGFLNHKQFGNDMTNDFIIDKSAVASYDTDGTFVIDKTCIAGSWVCVLGQGAEFTSTSNQLKLYIPSSEHSLEVGDSLIVETVFNRKAHDNPGAVESTLESDVYDATCMYMHQHPTSSNSHPTEGAPILEVATDYIILQSDDNSYLNNSLDAGAGDYAFKVRPIYHYGIARNSFSIFRINPNTGVIKKGELPFKAQSICPSYSQSINEVSGTGSRFQGGRIWIAEKTSNLIHRVSVAKTNFEGFTKDKSLNPVWCTWWSSTDSTATFENEGIVEKEKPPTDRGHISDIVETWGLKGDTNSLINESDTRMWVQFYPNSGSTFGALDNFIYCGNTDSLTEGNIVNVNFCNRTIPLNHTGKEEQSSFDPHNRYGKDINEAIEENQSGLSQANESMLSRGSIISKIRMNCPGVTTSRWCWFNPHFINHEWNNPINGTNGEIWEVHFRRNDDEWDWDDPDFGWDSNPGMKNYAENIGWDSDAPEFEMIRYGLIPLGDNDFDGVIDGTGMPVSSAANVNVGFVNGKDCSSHSAAVLMQTDSNWIMNGQVAHGWPSNNTYHESTKTCTSVYHSGVGYSPGGFKKSAELFSPGAFFMVTSDIWQMEKGDASSTSNANVHANSAGASLILDDGNTSHATDSGKFSHASKSNTSNDGELEHWSSSDWTDADSVQLKDRVHLFRTATPHHLSIGNNLLFHRGHEYTSRGNSIFSQQNFHTDSYAHLCPVVGIVDSTHFLMNVTHNGNGRGDTGSSWSGASTYKDDDGSHSGVASDNLHWKVGGSAYAPDHTSSDGSKNRRFGGRSSVNEYKVEGGGVRFFSDGNNIGTTATDENYCQGRNTPMGVHTFNTSLLSFCHGRMIRPLGDKDVSGVSGFDIDNSISLWKPSLPEHSSGLVAYNEVNTYSTSSRSYLSLNRLYLTQREGTNTKVYSFDWDNIMPDTNNATFEGVEYSEDSQGREYSSHRSFGTYQLGDRVSDYRRCTADMTHYHMHGSDTTHESSRGRFRLAGARATQSANPGDAGAAIGGTGSVKQNFMIPGGFMIKAGADKWNGTQWGYDSAAMLEVGAAGLVPQMEGHTGDLQGGFGTPLPNSYVTGSHTTGGSLFTFEHDNPSPFLRKGMLNDLVAIWSFKSPMRDMKRDLSDNQTALNSDFSSDWIRGVGRSVARKVISSYATNGGANTLSYQIKTKESPGDSGWNENAPDNSLMTNSDATMHARDNVSGEVFVRTHYPLPFAPGTEAGQSVTFIQSRDAALAPVRLDMELLPAYVGYTGAGIKTTVKLVGNPSGGTINIYQGVPTEESLLGREIWIDGQNDGENLISPEDVGDEGNQVQITGSIDYDGIWTLGTSISGGITASGLAVDTDVVKYGQIEVIGSGKKSNPAILPNVQGLTICGNSWQLSTNRKYNRLLGITKAGTSKIGFINYQSTSNFFYSLGTSNSPRYYQMNEDFFWTDSQDISDTNQNGSLLRNQDSHLFTSEIGFAINPASSQGVGAANFTEHGDYTYKVSLVYDGYQEGPLSESIWRIDNINPGEHYNSYDIRVTVKDPNKRLTSICLYRKNNANDLYRLVSEVSTDSSNWELVQGNYVTTIFDDGGLEATFESRAGYSEFLTNPFVKYGMGASISGYHFVGNCSHPEIKDASHMIFRSLPGQFDLFNWANDFIALPTKPTAIANFAGRLYVFDEITTYRINPQTLAIEDTFEGSGCVSMKSIIVTDFGMFYCDRHNAYMHDGNSPQIISHSIKKGGGSDISSFSISDFSWEKTAGANSTMHPVVSFDNRRNAVLFFVEKPGDELVNHSRYYCWAFSILLQRWDLWEVSTGDDGSGTFDASKVIAPSSTITTTKGKNFVTQGDYLIDFLGGTNKKPWQFLTKKLTVGHQSQKKVWKNIQFIGNDDDVTTQAGDPKGTISIAIDDTIIGGSDKTFTKDSPDGKVTIKGTSKTGRYLQFLLTKMSDSLDAIGIVFRRKGIK